MTAESQWLANYGAPPSPSPAPAATPAEPQGDAYPGTQDPNALSSEEWAYLSNLLGYDAREAYDSFTKQYVIAAQHKRPGQAAGYDQVGLWTTGAPQNLQAGWDLTAANRPVYGIGADQYKPSPAQWRYFILNSTQGAAGVIAAGVSQYYEAVNGQAMPPELRQQIVDAVQRAPAAERADLLRLYQGSGVTGTTATSGLAQSAASAAQSQEAGAGVTPPSFIEDVISAWSAAHPTPSMLQREEAQRLQQQRNSVISDWISAFGSQPSTAQITEMMGMTAQQRADFISAQPAPGGAGVTLGNYEYHRGRLEKAGWQKYFGAPPTAQQIVWAMGQSDMGIQQFIDSSPSHHADPLTGGRMSIGEYEGTQKFASDLSNQFFGYDDPKHLLGLLQGKT